MVQRLLKIPERNSVLLLGPRGTGKSTLIRESLIREHALWVDLLQPEQEEELQRNPGSLREKIVGSGAKIGCDSYFDGECDSERVMKQECAPGASG